MKQRNALLIGLTLGAALSAGALAQSPTPVAGPTAGAVTPVLKDWQAPDISKLADDKYGQMVRLGKELMEHTYKYLGPEVKDVNKRYAGSNTACTSCHLDGGTRKYGNPLVGTFGIYPQYRAREDGISTSEERINGCFERSMNGRKLPVDSPEMKAMMTYLHFLSSGLPVGTKIEGVSPLKLKIMARAADPVAGKQVYAATCVACHGENGQGLRRGTVGDANGYQFPPLWGATSFNNGASLGKVTSSAGFIKANMPPGTTHLNPVLTDEQAFDVAAYINSHSRPVKPNVEADFPTRKNKPVDFPFPPYTPGFSAEQHKYGPWQPIIDAQKKGIFPPK